MEEVYSKNKNENLRSTQNRMYSFRDIKITPMKLQGLNPHAIPQNAGTDTSTGAIEINIPQLYRLIKTYFV